MSKVETLTKDYATRMLSTYTSAMMDVRLLTRSVTCLTHMPEVSDSQKQVDIPVVHFVYVGVVLHHPM